VSWFREHGFVFSLGLLIAAIAALPLIVGSPSLREELFLVLMLATLASSLNIIMGYTGYVSFGHVVFFGLGGYFAFYLMKTYAWNFVAAAFAAAVPSCLIALLIGMPILRLRGAYFALATIGINEATRAFANNFEPFGGAVGMFFNFSVYDAYGGARNAAQLAYLAMLAVLLATIGTSYAIRRSKFGLALLAIREDQDVAMVLGVRPANAKVAAYVISAFFPSLAGAIFFFKNGIIEPGPAFDLLRSIEALVMVMLGGIGTLAGPLVGAALYEELRGVLITNETLSNLHLFVAGLVLLVIVLFVTAGIVGTLRQRFAIVRRFVQ